MVSSSSGLAVIGGGFYGCFVALRLSALGYTVTIFEKEPILLGRASFKNQARIHQGYHYPRNLLTALRSRRNFQSFVDEFAPCIVSDFEHYYAIARQFSRLNARQFLEFSRRIEAPIEVASKEVSALFDRQLVEEVFKVTEFAFDAVKLREVLLERLHHANVQIRLNTEVTAITGSVGQFSISSASGCHGQYVALFNCGYAEVDKINRLAGAEPITLKSELAEIALIEPPPALRSRAITVMDGSYFSCMPFPSTPYYSLSHVRYTPHGNLVESKNESPSAERPISPRSRCRAMLLDAARYFPDLRHAVQRDSLFEIKTVLPRNETDDGRPILCRESTLQPGVFAIMGGKIDNAFDVVPFLKSLAFPGSTRNQAVGA